MTQGIRPFAKVSMGLSCLGVAAAIVALAWPSAPIEPGGVPTVAFLVLEPVENAFRALAASAFFALPTALVSLILREGWTLPMVLVALLNALVLVAAVCLVV